MKRIIELNLKHVDIDSIINKLKTKGIDTAIHIDNVVRLFLYLNKENKNNLIGFYDITYDCNGIVVYYRLKNYQLNGLRTTNTITIMDNTYILEIKISSLKLLKFINKDIHIKGISNIISKDNFEIKVRS